MSQIKDDKFITDLGKIIANSNINTFDKKIAKAQYDKSYNATIIGVNQDFTDDVTEEEQQTLIKKYSIPEVPDKDNYYTFKINGNYYVKSSNTDFKLYEKVIIRIPNGSWDNMYIEVQKDTVTDVSARWFFQPEKPMSNYKDGDYWARLRYEYTENETGNVALMVSKNVSDIFRWSEEKNEWVKLCSFVGMKLDDEHGKCAEVFNHEGRDHDSLPSGYLFGDYSHTEGYKTSAQGDYSHVEGYWSEAIGVGSHAEGDRTKAQGDYSHAEGNGTTKGKYSHAEGACLAFGDFSHADSASSAYAHSSHADSWSHAYANYSHADSGGTAGERKNEEELDTTIGQFSHAQCQGTATGWCSSASGEGTHADGENQSVIGKYNEKVGNDYLFVVGCGNSDSTRKNALQVDKNGNVIISGTLTATGGVNDDKTIEGRKGILVSASGKNTVISADIDGKTIILDEDNKLSAKTGSTYTAGEGISIADDEISVKYDEETMKILDNGKLASKGITCALVLKDENEVASLLPEYTEVPYIDGAAIVYGDKPEVIVCGNVGSNSAGVKLIEHATPDDLGLSRINNHLDAVYRQSLQMTGWFRKSSTTEEFGLNDLLTFNYAVQTNASTSETTKDSWRISVTITGNNSNNELTTATLSETTYDLNQSGFVLEWNTIYPPNNLQEYGSVEGYTYLCYINSSGEKKRKTASMVVNTRFQIPFASLNQYYAALALTEKPPESITG